MHCFTENKRALTLINSDSIFYSPTSLSLNARQHYLFVCLSGRTSERTNAHVQRLGKDPSSNLFVSHTYAHRLRHFSVSSIRDIKFAAASSIVAEFSCFLGSISLKADLKGFVVSFTRPQRWHCVRIREKTAVVTSASPFECVIIDSTTRLRRAPKEDDLCVKNTVRL